MNVNPGHSGSGQRRIAVVGSGVAGLTAAWIASRTAHVTLYEADDRLGGHADTHRVATPDGELAIDTGFIVHNRRTYPTLLRLFAELGVETQPSEMSLSAGAPAPPRSCCGSSRPRPSWRGSSPHRCRSRRRTTSAGGRSSGSAWRSGRSVSASRSSATPSLLERTMSQREGWAEYAARVPLFFPRPPRS